MCEMCERRMQAVRDGVVELTGNLARPSMGHTTVFTQTGRAAVWLPEATRPVPRPPTR